MSISSVINSQAVNNTAQQSSKAGMAGLGQADFLRLLTTQMSVQDPFDPVDNKEMIAQMAQFSSLSATTEMGDTLKSIAEKLDAVLAAQAAAGTDPTA